MMVRLNVGTLELDLAPELGGSIARFDHVEGDRCQHLLRPAAPGAANVLGMASFPLVPYANRIRGGTFMCDGVTVRLAPNLPGDPSPIHGQGWLDTWQVETADDHHARLSFVHEPGEWPWRYEAWQDYALDDKGLTVTLACRNLSAARMPCGLAQHPYFPCDADTTIDAAVASAWTADAQTLPVDNVAPEGRFALRARKICGADLDNAFDGWAGTATIEWPDQPMRLRMSSPDAMRFHIYSPMGGGYFAAEPVQNAVAALNAPQSDWPGLGIVLLEQGDAHQMTMRFDLEQ